MMNEPIAETLLRDYLNGKLPPDEREKLQQRLTADPELAEKAALLQLEMAAAEQLIATETRALFRQWQQENATRHGFRHKNALLWLLCIVAGLALVLVLFRLANPGRQTPSNKPGEKYSPQEMPAPAPETNLAPPPVAAAPPAQNYPVLAARYLPEPPGAGLRRSAADTARSAFRQAEQAYAAGRYLETLALLAQTDSARLQSATYLSALALFHLQRFGEAETQFKRLIALDSRQFGYAAAWGLLLCRVADMPRSEKETRRMLHDILAQPRHPYLEQAKALKAALEKQ